MLIHRLVRGRGAIVAIVSVIYAWIGSQLGLRRLIDPVSTVASAVRNRGGWFNRGPARAGRYSVEKIPVQFLNTERTLERARERWERTLAWRAAERVDDVLVEANAVFSALKTHHPHYLHLADKEGRLTYYELPGRSNMSALKALGITPQMAYRHYVWHTEYTWEVAAPQEKAQVTQIFDLAGLSWELLSLELLTILKLIMSFSGTHYPDRAARILVINTPSWYTTVYGMVKPAMTEATREKIVFLQASEVASGGLLKWIPKANLPVAYGGTSKVPFGEAKVEKAMRAFVERANRKAGVTPLV